MEKCIDKSRKVGYFIEKENVLKYEKIGCWLVQLIFKMKNENVLNKGE